MHLTHTITILACAATTVVAFIPHHPSVVGMISSATAVPDVGGTPVSTSSTLTGAAYAPSPVMLAYEFDTLGRQQQQRGALNAAVESYEAAISHHATPDRYFRLGLALAENGEPTRAIESYILAKESPSSDPTLRHDVSLKMAHTVVNDLGNVLEGIKYVDSALGEVGFEDSRMAMDQKAFFVAATGQIREAIELWNSVLKEDVFRLDSNTLGEGVDDDARFFRAVAREMTGNVKHSQEDFAALPPERQFMVDSWRYVFDHPPHVRQRPQQQVQQHMTSSPKNKEGDSKWWHRNIFSGTHTNLASAFDASSSNNPNNNHNGGIVCEFGVFHGKSIRIIASLAGPYTKVDGFDTFEGLPEDWGDDWGKGSYTAASEVPQRVPDNVRFHVGLFADTLPGYVASLPSSPDVVPVRFINVDCDLYHGTVDILHHLAPRIVSGTIIVFDEYLMNPTWYDDEYKAFQEACIEFGWEYEYLSFSLFSKQAVVRITVPQEK
ncbi:hypothetical protein ACHAXR_010667 [Thalassiosira sp. AJA248-18]